ncbi:alanine racemase [Facklamia miroungae]|uniref:Alanine racemase n=1 Tax=Facklamia miroungae TaxID=120956 RepID=A0A1G7S467_9LACT|nr:alanine racemase [Facklamia miroungae]NKZ29185.1 alanine racemase [Facklamia miroungae]SDG17249.1 alanine racemase [Facklamia miroungae]
MYRASEHRPTQAVVNLENIKHNIQLYQTKKASHQQIYAVVKANAYGHGAIPVAKTAIEAGVTGLCVATVDEAIQLRKAGISNIPILVMGLTLPYGIAEILYYDLTVTVSDLSFFMLALEQLKKNQQETLLKDRQLKVHLKLDTGMSRVGLRTKEEVIAFVDGIQAFPWVDWQGVFTHFSTAGGGPISYIDFQWNRWQELVDLIPASVTLRHFDNSAMGLYKAIGGQSDIIRLGISLYGLNSRDTVPNDLVSDQQLADYHFSPSEVRNTESQLDLKLKPAFQLITELSYVKKVEKGTCISYGASYVSQEDEWIGTIPIGYADGWLRAYSQIPVLVEGHACPVLGVINMDQLMIRLPKQFPLGTEVTLIGQDGKYYNHPSLLARIAGTISYEMLTCISERVPRIYI